MPRFSIIILSKKGNAMYGTMICKLCPNTKLEGTLLTREQIEEISTRISKGVSENVSKQLEKAIASSRKTEKGAE